MGPSRKLGALGVAWGEGRGDLRCDVFCGELLALGDLAVALGGLVVVVAGRV